METTPPRRRSKAVALEVVDAIRRVETAATITARADAAD
jgi:hypothetical protein